MGFTYDDEEEDELEDELKILKINEDEVLYRRAPKQQSQQQ